MSPSEYSEWSEKHGRENLYCFSEHTNHYEQTVGRNMCIKDIGEGSEENEKRVFRNWKKGLHCITVNCIFTRVHFQVKEWGTVKQKGTSTSWFGTLSTYSDCKRCQN